MDTAQLVQDTQRTLAHQLTARQVQVSVGPLPVVQADALALSQIFDNLLANAVAYLDPSRPGALAITATQAPERTVFAVQDNGRGIAAADIPHIFKPFRRVGRQNVAGEGMGLTYVQMLVRRHGGDITCTSTLGEGTTFTFTLAQARPEQALSFAFILRSWYASLDLALRKSVSNRGPAACLLQVCPSRRARAMCS